jgi:hypothetical protein
VLQHTLYAATYFSGTINRHIFSAVLFYPTCTSQERFFFLFFLIMLSISWRSVLFLGADTSGVDAVELGSVD